MATKNFYNENRKRRSFENSQMTKKIKEKNSVSLIKMAQATRTFWTQAEALEFMTERQKTNHSDEILYLFSFESQPDGRRRYQVADIDVFIHEYYQLPANQRHTYEIIIDKKPSKLYFDLEFETAANPTLDGARLTNNFIQFVLNFMRKRSDDLNYSFKDVLILDSTSKKKFSRHLIFQTKDPFLDNIAVGKFVNLILEDVHGCLINHQCASMSPTDLSSAPAFCSDSSVFAKNLLISLQTHLNKFDRCQCVDDYSELKYRDIREFIIQKGDESGVTWFCDMGVYTKNRAFRLLRSSKFEKQECFTVAPENQWKPLLRPNLHHSTEPNESERQIFMASLVYFNQPIRRFIHVDDELPTTVINSRTNVRPAARSAYTSEDLNKITLDYPELVKYMSDLAHDRKENRHSRLYKGKEIQNDFRWEISFLYVGDYRYCERIGRHHKQNNIYFVVDMRRGTYRQKCHDSDCRTFQGVERELPKDATPWLMILDDQWEDDNH